MCNLFNIGKNYPVRILITITDRNTEGNDRSANKLIDNLRISQTTDERRTLKIVATKMVGLKMFYQVLNRTPRISSRT